MESQDVIIVGAGVIGLNTAYELAKNNIKVSLIDQFLPYRKASWAAHVSPHGFWTCSMAFRKRIDDINEGAAIGGALRALPRTEAH